MASLILLPLEDIQGIKLHLTHTIRRHLARVDCAESWRAEAIQVSGLLRIVYFKTHYVQSASRRIGKRARLTSVINPAGVTAAV